MRETGVRAIGEKRLRTLSLALLSGLVCVPLAGCIAVGYSSRGGWFVWPGGLGLLLLIALLLLVLRRR